MLDIWFAVFPINRTVGLLSFEEFVFNHTLYSWIRMSPFQAVQGFNPCYLTSKSPACKVTQKSNFLQERQVTQFL